MEESKNTYIFNKSFTVNKKRNVIIPDVGDEFVLCKDYGEVCQMMSNAKPNLDKFKESGHPVEYYSSENLGEEVTDYQYCYGLSINSNMYEFFGYGLKHPDGKVKRKFYLYETE